MKHLNLLAKLENITSVIQKAVKECSILNTGSSENKVTKPFRGHVLHTACLLHAGMQFLGLKCKDGKYIHQKIFGLILEDINRIRTLWPSYFIETDFLEKLSYEEKELFIYDCWILTALIHDIGYLPMIEILIFNARKGVKLESRGYTNLKQWLTEVRSHIIKRLSINKKELGTKLEDLLPTIGYANTDVNTIDSNPEKFHGLVSGYMMLKYLLQKKDYVWGNLSPMEKYTAFTVCSAAMFHCVKNDQREFGNIETWNSNPLGTFLRMVDIIQEWVRVVWLHCDFEQSTGFIDSSHPKIYPLNGLNIILGQCPIPVATVTIKNGIFTLEYEEAPHNLAIKGPKELGLFDSSAMLDKEKTQDFKNAFETLTEYQVLIKLR